MKTPVNDPSVFERTFPLTKDIKLVYLVKGGIYSEYPLTGKTLLYNNNAFLNEKLVVESFEGQYEFRPSRTIPGENQDLSESKGKIDNESGTYVTLFMPNKNLRIALGELEAPVQERVRQLRKTHSILNMFLASGTNAGRDPVKSYLDCENAMLSRLTKQFKSLIGDELGVTQEIEDNQIKTTTVAYDPVQCTYHITKDKAYHNGDVTSIEMREVRGHFINMNLLLVPYWVSDNHNSFELFDKIGTENDAIEKFFGVITSMSDLKLVNDAARNGGGFSKVKKIIESHLMGSHEEGLDRDQESYKEIEEYIQKNLEFKIGNERMNLEGLDTSFRRDMDLAMSKIQDDPYGPSQVVADYLKIYHNGRRRWLNTNVPNWKKQLPLGMEKAVHQFAKKAGWSDYSIKFEPTNNILFPIIKVDGQELKKSICYEENDGYCMTLFNFHQPESKIGFKLDDGSYVGAIGTTNGILGANSILYDTLFRTVVLTHVGEWCI